MKALNFLVAALVALMSSQALAGYETATNIGQEKTGDLILTRCLYRTMGGYQFSIIVRGGLCPFSVEIDPETGRVRN